jgi:hypothetical protein
MFNGPPPGAAPGAPAPPPSKPRRRTGVWVAVGVGVIALLVLAAIIGSLPSGTSNNDHNSTGPSPPPPPPPSTGNNSTHVNVTKVEWHFTGASCWNGTNSSGTSVNGGATFNVSLPLTYTAAKGQPNSCTVDSESMQTSGFTLLGSNTPLEISSGSSATLVLEITAPNKNESEPLAVDGTAAMGPWPSSVNVSAVNWDFSGPSECWSDMSTKGKVVVGGDQFAVTISLSYTAGLLDPDSCTVQSASVSTSGFTYINANTPLVVDSGATQTLSVTLQAPDTNETVALTIDGTVTAP